MANWFNDLDENESEIWSKLNQLNFIKILKKNIAGLKQIQSKHHSQFFSNISRIKTIILVLVDRIEMKSFPNGEFSCMFSKKSCFGHKLPLNLETRKFSIN